MPVSEPTLNECQIDGLRLVEFSHFDPLASVVMVDIFSILSSVAAFRLTCPLPRPVTNRRRLRVQGMMGLGAPAVFSEAQGLTRVIVRATQACQGFATPRNGRIVA